MVAPNDATKRPMTIEDLYEIVEVNDPQISPDGRWVAYVCITVDRLKNNYQRNIWLAPTTGGDPIQLTRSGKDTEPRWSPDGNWLAFTSTRDEKSQIYLLPTAAPGGEARALTNMQNGASDPVWSPDGRQIAFLAALNAEERAREDRGETPAPPADELEARHRKERHDYDDKKRFDPRIHTQLPYREGTSYLPDRFKQLYVIEPFGQDKPKPRRLTNLDTHYESPRWTPDGQYLVCTRSLHPDYDEPRRWETLYRIQVETGQEEQLTDESHWDFNPLPSPDGKWIAYRRLPSASSGRANVRLALIPATGGPPRDLTLELDRSVEAVCWAVDSQCLIFSANDYGRTPVFAVSIADSNIKPLIDGAMAIEAKNMDLATDGSIAFTSALPAHPPEVFWKTPAAGEPRCLTGHNQPFLEKVMVQPHHEIRFKSADGTEVQGWYVLPVGYEAGQKYPLLLSIHGGPHLMYAPGTRPMWHEWQVQAARGYVVLHCNPRGSDGYGSSFRDGIHGTWGEKDFQDLMAGVDAMLEKGFVDPARLVVTGGSYGGFMTTWVISHTDRFKAAVAQRGVYHLMGFYGSTDIPKFVYNEFGVEPWDNPQQLWERSPVAYARYITTPLLLIHAENDYRVPVVEAELLFALLRRLGKTVKFIRYPNEGHEMTRSGEPAHRVSSLHQMMAWFDSYCYPPID